CELLRFPLGRGALTVPPVRTADPTGGVTRWGGLRHDTSDPGHDHGPLLGARPRGAGRRAVERPRRRGRGRLRLHGPRTPRAVAPLPPPGPGAAARPGRAVARGPLLLAGAAHLHRPGHGRAAHAVLPAAGGPAGGPTAPGGHAGRRPGGVHAAG